MLKPESCSPSTQPLIEVRDLCLDIDGVRILDRISLSIAGGEHVTVMGPNGAGKSTLIKCLAGIEVGWTGSIEIDRIPLQRYNRKQLARLVSYVPQADGRPMPFTVHEFVMMGRYPHLSPFSSPRAEDEQAVSHALRLTDTATFRDRRLDTLSGGERQAVYLAAALAQGGRIMLLDEPTAFLDYRHQIQIMRTIHAVNRQRAATIVMVDHDINNATRFSHGIVALREGRTAFRGTPAAFTDPTVLHSLFQTDFRLVQDPLRTLPLAMPAAWQYDVPEESSAE